MSNQTEAAVLFRLKEPLELVSLEIPELKPGQVLVEIAYSGVCRSQLLEVLGKRGEDPFLPHTLGHEGSGVVKTVGPGVKKVKAGDHVVLSWIKGKGLDAVSTFYTSKKGGVNSGAISTFMRQAIVSENRLTPIPVNVPLREAAMLGCVIPTGAGIVMNTAKVHAGSSVAIFGVGGVGLSAVMACHLVRAKIIVAIDQLPHKLDLAKEFGATHVFNSRTENPLEKVQALTNGGVDYAIESAGNRKTMEMAFKSVRPNGGLCILAGNLEAGENISIDPFDLIRGKKIIGTWGGETEPDRDIPYYVEKYVLGELKLGALITHEYPLAEINEALNDLKEGKVGRAVINLQS